MPFAVTEDHVLVPRSVRGTVSISFNDAYVWSFTTPRDGTWTPRGRRIAWPEILQRRLSGTTRVSLDDDQGRVFDEEVAFGGVTEPLELRDKEGHQLAVDSAGHLTRVFSETAEDVRSHVVEGARKALEDLRSNGYDAHLSYGCLLGAVREGAMIGHDSDADLAYISPYTTPAQVILESYAMERTMRRLGWNVVRMSGADLKLMHKLPDGRVVHIDIFGGFHVGDTFYLLGGRSGKVPRSALTPASTVVLEGVELPAPADPEAVLAFLYGPSWRTPDPAFQNVDPPGGLRRLEGWLRGVRTHVVEWNEFYRDRRNEIPREPSDFARWVDAQLPKGAPIVDIGAGTGRDAAWLYRRKRPTLAYEIAGGALRQTRKRMTHFGASAKDVRTLALNDRRSVVLAGAELSRTDVPVSLYARQLVGCLDDEALDHLWLLASMSLRRGGSLYVEFSTGSGAALDPPQLIHRVPLDRVVDGITARGGILSDVTVAPGLDFFDRPDPEVARVVAHWPHPAERGSTRKEPT